MAIVGKVVEGQGWCAVDELTGDFLCEVTKKFDKYPGRPELLYFRLHRVGDRQVFAIREINVYPEDKESRIEWVFNPPDAMERNKYGMILDMQPSWGSYFAIDELDAFMERLFEFVFAWYQNRSTPNITLNYKHKITGKKYSFTREFYKIGSAS